MYANHSNAFESSTSTLTLLLQEEFPKSGMGNVSCLFMARGGHSFVKLKTKCDTKKVKKVLIVYNTCYIQ